MQINPLQVSQQFKRVGFGYKAIAGCVDSFISHSIKSTPIKFVTRLDLLFTHLSSQQSLAVAHVLQNQLQNIRSINVLITVCHLHKL